MKQTMEEKSMAPHTAIPHKLSSLGRSANALLRWSHPMLSVVGKHSLLHSTASGRHHSPRDEDSKSSTRVHSRDLTVEDLSNMMEAKRLFRDYDSSTTIWFDYLPDDYSTLEPFWSITDELRQLR